MDFVKTAFESPGGELQFWKVAIRPGKPFVFRQTRWKISLRPAGQSRLGVCHLLCWCARRCGNGKAPRLPPPVYAGVLGEPVSNPATAAIFMHYCAWMVKGKFFFPLAKQASARAGFVGDGGCV